jgi:hypothetical protein
MMGAERHRSTIVTDERTSPILERLKRIPTKLADIGGDLGDLKMRTLAVENLLAAINHRTDRFDQRLGRIERRLEVVNV